MNHNPALRVGKHQHLNTSTLNNNLLFLTFVKANIINLAPRKLLTAGEHNLVK